MQAAGAALVAVHSSSRPRRGRLRTIAWSGHSWIVRPARWRGLPGPNLWSAGNVAVGRALAIDSEDCVILGNGTPVVVLGAKGLVVVQRPGGTLVCPLDRAEDVRKAVAELERRGWE